MFLLWQNNLSSIFIVCLLTVVISHDRLCGLSRMCWMVMMVVELAVTLCIAASDLLIPDSRPALLRHGVRQWW